MERGERRVTAGHTHAPCPSHTHTRDRTQAQQMSRLISALGFAPPGPGSAGASRLYTQPGSTPSTPRRAP